MSLLIYQLLHTLDFSYSFNGFNQILHCFYWGETIRFLMWLEGLQLLFEEKNHVYSFVVFKYSQYIKQCNLPFFFGQCHQSAWKILAAAFPFKSCNDSLLFALQNTGLILHPHVVLRACNIQTWVLPVLKPLPINCNGIKMDDSLNSKIRRKERFCDLN